MGVINFLMGLDNFNKGLSRHNRYKQSGCKQMYNASVILLLDTLGRHGKWTTTDRFEIVHLKYLDFRIPWSYKTYRPNWKGDIIKDIRSSQKKKKKKKKKKKMSGKSYSYYTCTNLCNIQIFQSKQCNISNSAMRILILPKPISCLNDMIN
jgi:hypothetical protein